MKQIPAYLLLAFLIASALLCTVSAKAQSLNVHSASAHQPPKAAIASAHPLATQAGKEILKNGGNAFDAAVAITATLAVVEPYSSGLGGGGFWLIRDQKQEKIIIIDGREKAPANAYKDMYLDQQGNYIPNSSVNGALSAGIPGTVAAMVHLSKKYGQLSLSEVLKPAIRYAQQGFPVTKHYQKMVSFRLKVLQKYPASSDIFLHNNQIPELGYLIIQSDLANTLKAIALSANDGFYTGNIATKLVHSVASDNGIWQLEDLKNYRVIERQPIQFRYKNMHISSVPPPSSGGIALATILQILQNFDLPALDYVTQTHLIVEAMRRAYRDRAEFLGDADFVAVPVERLMHPWYAKGLSESIRMDKAMPSDYLPGIQGKKTEGQDTTHFSVLDTQGNLVSATMSINYPFGSGFTVQGTGVLLNDEMDDFSARPGTPNVYGLVGAQANAIAPNKRPLSSMSPTIVETDQGVILLGTPGGSRIITMVLLAILELDKNKGEMHWSPKQWISKARFHHQYLPDKIFYEPQAFSKEELLQLEQMGHKTKALGSVYGNMQAITWHYENGVQAASDPRVEGFSSVFELP